MNKSDLIGTIVDASDLTKTTAGKVLDSLTDAITEALKKGESVTIIGFGTFHLRERPARTGRNPRTGETIEIAASKTPIFKAGKSLREAVNE